MTTAIHDAFPIAAIDRRLCVVIAAVAVALTTPGGIAFTVAADTGFRVESEVFVKGGDEPVARSLTLFRDGIAWDFLESQGDGTERQAGGQAAREIVLHDPARERVILIDPARKLKTQIETVRLERLSVSLATWARKSDDRLVRWAGGPDFGEGMTESRERIELVGPRVRYTVDWIAAPSAEAAADYRRFADTAILLKSLVRPGGLPPFARLAINRRVSAVDGIPSAVTLEIDSRAALVTGRSDSLRSTHKLHPRLLTGDIDRIEEAESQVALARDVDLAVFMNTPATGE